MVRPQFEYASAIWDLYYNNEKKTNWNQSSKGLLDGFLVIIEELVQYHQCYNNYHGQAYK